MNLVSHYDEAIASGEINNDPAQRMVLSHLQRLADDLEKPQPRWFNWGKAKVIKGAYIYGPVGAGKTYLVDFFYRYVNEKKKARFHFHHFMQQVDAQLRKLQGHKDPLRLVAKEIARTTRLLCFDEFLVQDVAYAMILAELLKALHAEGVVLVISANTKPDDLYLNGPHRVRFLPAIALLNNNCDVLNLDEHRDYRLGRKPLLDAYLYPLNDHTTALMQMQFHKLEQDADIKRDGFITIQTRDIPFIQRGIQTIWFAFDDLCNLPRSQLDYLEIADRFNAVFLSGIPCLTVNHTAQTIMLVHCIDVMYDRGIKVVISAAVPVEQLYVEGEIKETFKRTLSRLLEMQSVDYQNRHPRRELPMIGSNPLI